MRVTTKAQSVALMQSGFYGNRPLILDTADQVEQQLGDHALIVARNRKPEGRCIYDTTIAQLRQSGCDLDRFYYQVPMQPNNVTMNAEMMRVPGAWALRYSTLQMHMRPALQTEQHHVFGLQALEVVRRFACPRGYDCLMELWSLVDDDHVIEFSTFRQPCGHLNWCTVVWEVRAY